MPTQLPPNVRLGTPLAEDHAGFDVTEERAMRALARAEEAHFWHRSRNALLADELRDLGVVPPAKILELGCGGGCVTASLARAGYLVTGVDGHPSLVARAALRAPDARFVVHDLSTGAGPLEGDNDAVALFDVIEHLDHPLAAIELALGLTRRGGVVVGTVPALMLLWSAVDEQAGHRVRYDRAGLSKLLERVAGADVVKLTPFNRVLVPMMLFQRRIVARPSSSVGQRSEENFAVPPRPLNAALYALTRAEAKGFRFRGSERVPGSSLFFALRKR
jgi:2-polyprenyl-3-methyl-5-hydroxy-6-metoxy-1,4-benzoquinol methylase